MKLRLRNPFSDRPFDVWLYLLPILLSGISVALIASLTYGSARISLAVNQGIYAGVGILLMLILTRIDYRNWRGLAPVLYVGIVGLLVAVAQFGVTIFGAKRWLAIGGFQLQPSELAKLGLIIMLARFFADRETLRARDYVWLLILIGLPVGLVMRQPDLGTAIVLAAISFVLLIAGGVPKKVIGGLVGVGLVAAPFGWALLADYQRQRLLTFLNPEADPYGAGYNVTQALIAVGSGGMFGQGFGQGSQSQLQFLPVAHTDFIFATVGEATGFIGSMALLILEALLMFRVIRVAQHSRDQFGYLVGVGLATLLLVQTTINVAMNLGLAPVTGIPLPFISHGGTALMTYFIAIGILQSVMLRHKKIAF